RLGADETLSRTVDHVERVDAAGSEHPAHVCGELTGCEVPGHDEVAERIADHEVTAARRLTGQAYPCVTDDDPERRPGTQAQPGAVELDQLFVDLQYQVV